MFCYFLTLSSSRCEANGLDCEFFLFVFKISPHASGLGFVCFVVFNPLVFQQSWFGLFCFINCPILPPPPIRELYDLPNLEELYVSHNELTELSLAFPVLKVLSAHHNKVCLLPQLSILVIQVALNISSSVILLSLRGFKNEMNGLGWTFLCGLFSIHIWHVRLVFYTTTTRSTKIQTQSFGLSSPSRTFNKIVWNSIIFTHYHIFSICYIVDGWAWVESFVQFRHCFTFVDEALAPQPRALATPPPGGGGG